MVLEVTEEVLRQTLERCAAYFTLVDGQPQISEEFLLPKVEHYNYDFYAGLAYTFDLRRPVGRRVVRLAKLDGSPLGGGTFRLCTSNYRATGTGGYDVLRKCPGPLARRRRNAGSHRPLYPDPQSGAGVA